MIIETKEIKESFSTIENSSRMILKLLDDYNKKRAVTNVYELENKLENIEQSYSKFAQMIPTLNKSMPALKEDYNEKLVSLIDLY